ncbi:hypothetical protein Landi51_07334 [Colletotrichum acutatum]
MIHFPNIFKEWKGNKNAPALSKDNRHFAWGYSHEDWTRAYYMVSMFLYRRRTHEPMLWDKRAARVTEDVSWASYYNAEEAAVEESEALTYDREMALASRSLEELVVPVYSDLDEDTDEDTEERQHVRFQNDLERMGMQDELDQYNKIYSPALTDTEVETLRWSIRADQQHLILEMFQPARKTTSTINEKAAALRRSKLTNAEVKVLLGIAETIANVKEYERAGRTLAKDTRLLAVSKGEGDEAIRHALAAERNTPAYDAAEVHNPGGALQFDPDAVGLAESRRLMGENLPQDNDLVRILSEFLVAPQGATWKNCPISPDQPDFCLKPHQIIDIAWLLAQLSHPIRAAILANECDTGKTVTALFALAEAIARHKATNENDPSATYKPSAIVVPASVLDQTHSVIVDKFYHLFRVHVFYQEVHTAPRSRQKNTIGSQEDFVALIQRFKSEEAKPETANSIILMTYSTNNRRLIPSDHQSQVNVYDEESDQGEEKVAAEFEDDFGNPNKQNTGSGKSSRSRGGLRTRNGHFDLPCEVDLFGFITDEGHIMRNHHSLSWIICAKFKKEFCWLLTATPTVSGVHDLHGYMLAFWENAFGYRSAPANSDSALEIIYTDRFVEAFKKRDQREMARIGLQFNTLMTTTEKAFAQAKDGGDTGYSLSKFQEDRRKDYRTAMENGIPVYLLNPQNFLRHGRNTKWSVEFTSTAVKHALAMCQVRRGMLTPITLPDGTQTCLGEDMPPCDVQTIELAHRRRGDVASLEKFINRYTNDMLLQPASSIIPTEGGAGEINDHTTSRINIAAMRNASLVSTNLRFAALTDPSRRLARATIDGSAAAKMNDIIPKDATHCLQYYYLATRIDSALGCPTDIITLARYAISGSPKMAWCLKYALDLSNKGERCLFYTISPLTAIAGNGDFSSAGRVCRQLSQCLPQRRGGGELPKPWPTMATLDPWIETRNLRAYASNVEAEAAIDDRNQGPLRTICAFEILRFYIGAGYNYYPRCWRPWNLLTSDEVREEGILLSAVAQWLMAHPEDAGDAVPMIEIAKRWNNSMPMTRDIIVGAARELGGQNYIKFDWFTAMDPSLGDPEERAKLFKVLGI